VRESSALENYAGLITQSQMMTSMPLGELVYFVVIDTIRNINSYRTEMVEIYFTTEISVVMNVTLSFNYCFIDIIFNTWECRCAPSLTHPINLIPTFAVTLQQLADRFDPWVHIFGDRDEAQLACDIGCMGSGMEQPRWANEVVKLVEEKYSEDDGDATFFYSFFENTRTDEAYLYVRVILSELLNGFLDPYVNRVVLYDRLYESCDMIYRVGHTRYVLLPWL
jgi:hypothetical protein